MFHVSICDHILPPCYRRPEIDRSTKPRTDHFTSTGGQTSNKHGLRDIIVPEELLAKFLRLAQTNSRSNMETCGILCGQLVSASWCVCVVCVRACVCTCVYVCVYVCVCVCKQTVCMVHVWGGIYVCECNPIFQGLIYDITKQK